MAILQDTSSENAMLAELAALRAENERLKANKAKSNGLKVSAKGALSLYGMGRWPVTLYKAQWLKVLDMAQEIRDFIELHDDVLASKPDAE
jgi:hypothetical protein